MGRVTDAELNEKLARLGARVAARSESTRDQLEALGAIELAEAARATFQARLVYLGPDAGFPHGHPYDFGALFYLAARRVCPWLPKKNLWQCSGMFLCTEWVTRYLDGAEDSMKTTVDLSVEKQSKSHLPPLRFDCFLLKMPHED